MKQLKKYICLLVALFFWGQAMAQKEHFVYLQTEDLKPFYIRMEGRTISSTASGYLIIGKLTDNVYPMKLGILGMDVVQDYGLSVAGRDAGYLVKKMSDGAWALVDLQTNATQLNMEWSSEVEAALNRQKFLEAEKQRNEGAAEAVTTSQTSKAAAADSVAKPIEKIDTVVAATAVQSSVPQKTDSIAQPVDSAAKIATEVPAMNAAQQLADSIAMVIAEKEKELKALQAQLALASAAKTSTATADSVAVGTENAAREIKEDESHSKTSVTVVEASKDTAKTAENKAPVFLNMELGADTKAQAKKDTGMVEAVKDAAGTNSKMVDSMVVPAKPTSMVAAADTAATPVLMADSIVAASVVAADSAQAKPAPLQEAYVKMNRNPCTGIIGRTAIDELLEKSARLSDRDEIVNLYKTAFKENCVTTANLRKIASTFASDVTRYQVLEAAYPHTLDYYAFGELSTLLSDKYYLNQFKSLLQR